MSNIIYNICPALGNNTFILNTGGTDTTYTIPTGYYTLGPHSQNDFITAIGAILPVNSIVLELLYPTAADATYPYNIMPTEVNGLNYSTSNPILKVTVKHNYILKKAPNILGIDQLIGSGIDATASDVTVTTTSYGFRNTINVCLNTQVLFNLNSVSLSSSTLSVPIAPAYATYGCGHMILSQNGYAASSPTNYETEGPSPQGDMNSTGIVLGTIPVPYTSQTGSVTYAGPIISIPGAGNFPLCKPPLSMTYMTLSFCDDYGYLYYINGQVEATIQITAI
jgi:hypothetical protein